MGNLSVSGKANNLKSFQPESNFHASPTPPPGMTFMMNFPK